MFAKKTTALFALLSFLLFGCAQKVNNTYTIVKENRKTYLKINEQVMKSIGASELGAVPFDSVDDFIKTVKNGKLAEWQLSVALTAFPKDETGILICDFDHIYCPADISGMNDAGVSWSGEQYAFFLEGKDGETATMVFCTADDFLSKLSSYDSFFEKDTVNLISQENINEEAIYRYSTSKGEFKQIRYTFENSGRKYTVDEMYRLKIDDETLPCSETAPIRTTLYIEENGIFCFTQIFDMNERAGTDRLSEFYLTEYNS